MTAGKWEIAAREFVNEEGFVTYFTSRKDEMRFLLGLYTTPEVTWDALLALPKNQVSDDESRTYFFQRFSSDCFLLAADRLVPSLGDFLQSTQ